ncbi:DMT family transporter [Roseovarius faecimaris]|uniref:DMT family transporter n=1 Tax=Roseovarius faecimaris TaxID=2494550 RepID=A0A6I6IRJ9_9RHOB|nr:DMT family transporter [Roseovarius faecimaris]QGX97886.1 DMT family transporter [Roseovarius faecimaris]
MRLLGVTCLVMLAFAGNGLLTRAGVTVGGLMPMEFAVVRLFSGALTLALLCLVLRGALRLGGGRGRLVGVVALLIYLIGYSLAYTDIDAGIGALIVFGMVQITMFAGGLVVREAMPVNRWVGAGLAFAGLIWLLWPAGAVAVSLWHGALMAVAGIGWGLYSLAGRQERDALQGTAGNFILAALGVLAVVLMLGGGGFLRDVAGAEPLGLWLALGSGVVTSAMGYALWYTVLPRLPGTVAATAQLTVPVITMAGGMIWLGEALTLRFGLASVLVLGGVALSVRPQRGRSRSSGS